jgi:hypothetical protein
MVGVENYCAVLDCVAGVRSVRADDAEAEVRNDFTTEPQRHGEKRRKIVFRGLTAKNNLGGFERLRHGIGFFCVSVAEAEVRNDFTTEARRHGEKRRKKNLPRANGEEQSRRS